MKILLSEGLYWDFSISWWTFYLRDQLQLEEPRYVDRYAEQQGGHDVAERPGREHVTK